jgi:hypothetical protein
MESAEAGGEAGNPSRQVFHADAIVWLAEHSPLVGCSVVTSLPDVSELPELGFDKWRDWFVAAAGLVLRSIPSGAIAIFFQSDVLHGGRWVDKAALVNQGAAATGTDLLSHKIVCRKPPGSASFGRASYAHMLSFGHDVSPARIHARVDVLPDGGERSGAKAMGALACRDACLDVLRMTRTRTIVDPFCGFGTVLAVANALGLHSVGVDISAKMCRKARNLSVALPAPAAATSGSGSRSPS